MPDTSPSNPPETPPGNVYVRKEPRASNKRRDGTDRLESGAPVARPARRNDDNLARQTFIASVRKFAIVSAIMGGCVYVVMRILATMDEQYWSKFQLPEETDSDIEKQVMPTQSYARAVAAALVEPARSTNAPDTGNDAMRQSAFLAKRASDLVAAGHLQEAINDYRKALDLWPYMTQRWIEIGRLYMRVGDLPRAQTALERASQESPGDASLLNDLGVVYLKQGNSLSAIRTFRACVAVDPSSSASYFNLSLAYMGRNDMAAAHEYLDRYLNLVPDDPRALRQAAYFDAATNNFVSAIASIEKAIAKAPDWAVLYLDAAAAQAMAGDTEKAIGYLEHVKDLVPPSTVQRRFESPAFSKVRTTPAGIAFGTTLAERLAQAAPGETGETASAQALAPISSVSK